MKLPQKDSCLLCLEGWDEQQFHKLQKWVNEGSARHLIFLDRDPHLLLKFPGNPKSRIFIINDHNEEEIFRQIAWQYLFLPLQTTSKKLREIHAEINGCAGDFADMGVRLVNNVRENLKTATFAGSSLFGKFEKIPAIICGAGPSLVKNGRLLQELGDRAILLAGGAGVEAARRLDVTPHFAAHVDPDPDHPFLRRLSYDIPLFYQLRTCFEVVAKCEGPKLLIEGSGNFPLESWTQQKVGLSEEPFDGGWTVGCFCAALAVRLGCDPIVFVGMDLEGDRHDWVLAARWIEQLAASNPTRRWINATEGGVGFQGVDNIPLSSVLGLFQQSYNIRALSEKVTPLAQQLPIIQEIDRSILSSYNLTMTMLQNGPTPLLEHELDQEIAQQKIVNPIWEIWKYPILRHNAHGELGEKVNRLIFTNDVYRNLSGY